MAPSFLALAAWGGVGGPARAWRRRSIAIVRNLVFETLPNLHHNAQLPFSVNLDGLIGPGRAFDGDDPL